MDRGKDSYSAHLEGSIPFSFGAGDAIAESARIAEESAKNAGPNSSEYWKARGYSDEEALEKIMEHMGFEEGGPVPKEKKEVGFWKGFKDKVVGDFEKRKQLFGEGKPYKPQYKNIGGYTKGPLGMSDMQVAGKPKDVSKVKIKKSKGDMSEEVELNYHAPLADKPKPTGE